MFSEFAELDAFDLLPLCVYASSDVDLTMPGCPFGNFRSSVSSLTFVPFGSAIILVCWYGHARRSKHTGTFFEQRVHAPTILVQLPHTAFH